MTEKPQNICSNTYPKYSWPPMICSSGN